jgi:enolase-phosphatase E1
MIQAIVTDIEGTTSSLTFVKEVLFPYAREHIAEFARLQGTQPEVRDLLDEARRVAERDLDDVALVQQLVEWMDEDRKVTPLKALQGMIWEQGYLRGDFRGHVYEDAARNLRRWKAMGVSLYVFSSGSVQAQRLLFAHTQHGDLTPLFAGYFDTRIGSKQEPASYRAIAHAVGLAPEAILFLSDVEQELDAAKQAGLQTRWLVREGSAEGSTAHAQAADFDAVSF